MLQQPEQFLFLPQDVVDLGDVLLGEFGVVESLEGAIGQIDLVHTTAAQRQDGVNLLHHINIVQAIQAIPAPAYIFKRTGHIFLPVEIIRLVA